MLPIAEKIKAAQAKPENERTEEERLMIQAFEDYKRRAVERLKGE